MNWKFKLVGLLLTAMTLTATAFAIVIVKR